MRAAALAAILAGGVRAGALAAILPLAAGVAACGSDDRAPSSTTASRADSTTHGAGESALDGGGGGGRPLTMRQLVGQRFVFSFDGLRPPAALERRIGRGEAAGVILFSRNVESAAAVSAIVARLQRIPRPGGLDEPLLVLVDQEGGPVRRIPGPPQAAAAETSSAGAARTHGRAAARLLRSAGVNVDLAPVVDVARPGGALERERRTYGRDAATVASLAGGFAAGLRDGGVEPVLKHFPGFGAASINTDDGPTRIELPLAELRRVDQVPYRRLRPRAVMLSTAVYPRVDPRPAAFSRRWVTEELRGRLGFAGVTVTDDLQTPAVQRFGTPAQLAFFAMRAGVDLPLFARSYAVGAQAAAGLERAVREGVLPRRELEAGAQRVLALRRALGAAR